MLNNLKIEVAEAIEAALLAKGTFTAGLLSQPH